MTPAQFSELNRIQRRLEYAQKHLDKVSKHMRRTNPEHDQFFRGYDALVESAVEVTLLRLSIRLEGLR